MAANSGTKLFQPFQANDYSLASLICEGCGLRDLANDLASEEYRIGLKIDNLIASKFKKIFLGEHAPRPTCSMLVNLTTSNMTATALC